MTPRLTYFKRFRMGLDLNGPIPEPGLPEPLRWLGWDDRLIDTHAEVKFHCFRDEMDSQLFPSLGHLNGCRDLMRVIRSRRGFCAEATWLIAGPDRPFGTVQGLIDDDGFGAIQNLGLVPECRGIGLGTALLAKSLRGFRLMGVRRVYLEVTAKNLPAVRLYRSFGFRSFRTIYKAVPEQEPVPVGMGI